MRRRPDGLHLHLEEPAHLLDIEGPEPAPVDAGQDRLAWRGLNPDWRLVARAGHVWGWSQGQAPIGWRRCSQAEAFGDYWMSWTEERIERLKAMWTEGATASQIADELGGVSRNAVIGKAHRLGLEARPSPVKPGEEKERHAPAAASAPAPKPAPAERAAPRATRRHRSAQNRPRLRSQPTSARSAPSPTISSIARSVRAGSSVRAPATSRRRSRRLRRAAWFRPSRARKSPTRPACSISTTASANGRWGIRASPTSISAAMPRTPASPIASSIAASRTRRSFRAATAARPRRCRSADRAFASPEARP